MDFSGQVVLITGGSSGIGLACAKQFAAQGACAWLLARRKAQLEAALQQVRAGAAPGTAQRCGYVVADVTQPEQVQRALGEVTAAVGLPDILVNSAGMSRSGYFEKMEIDHFQAMIEVNYYGTLVPTRAIVPGMIQRGSGTIVNISSLGGLIGAYGFTAYCASKFAVHGFSDALRSEMQRYGIRVAIVFPPDTDTPGLAEENKDKMPELAALTSEAGLMQPDQVAGEILSGLKKGRYMILPGAEAKFYHWLSNILGSARYPVMDWYMARAQKKAQKEITRRTNEGDKVGIKKEKKE